MRGLDLIVPVMQAPIGGCATPELAIAVSRAGGLGSVAASWTDPDLLRERIRLIAREIDRPFCVNLVLEFEQDERLEVAVEEHAPIISLSFGLRPDLIARAKASDALVLVQVGSGAAARAAADAGADALIVQGVEAGGHVQSTIGLLPLLAEVRRSAPLPVLAAGGIGDPPSARAALAAGAVATVMGTRFVATDESNAHPVYKSRLLEAEAADTVLTGLFDVGWKDSPHRVLRNSTYRNWEAAGAPPSGARPDEQDEVATDTPRYASNPPLADTEGDIEAMALYSGQSVGSIAAIEPAGEIVERFAASLRN